MEIKDIKNKMEVSSFKMEKEDIRELGIINAIVYTHIKQGGEFLISDLEENCVMSKNRVKRIIAKLEEAGKIKATMIRDRVRVKVL